MLLRTDYGTEVERIIEAAIEFGASDIHMEEHREPWFRIDGDLVTGKLSPADSSDMDFFLNSYIKEGYRGKDGDFSFTFRGYRFRGNHYFSNDKQLTLAIRRLPLRIPSLADLDLPAAFNRVRAMHHGIVLVTGPTGSGKSTTIAALIQQLLRDRNSHLITIENPVEYLFESTHCSLVHQREIGRDTETFHDALKYALRQDPDIILVGEIRDPETARLAVNAAETGHLVFATLHTISVEKTVNRLCGLFQPEERPLVQQQIAEALQLVVSQRLLKKPGGGRHARIEALFPNDPVRALIREGRTHEMPRHYEGGDYLNTFPREGHP